MYSGVQPKPVLQVEDSNSSSSSAVSDRAKRLKLSLRESISDVESVVSRVHVYTTLCKKPVIAGDGEPQRAAQPQHRGPGGQGGHGQHPRAQHQVRAVGEHMN